jgi:hypothetical protein
MLMTTKLEPVFGPRRSDPISSVSVRCDFFNSLQYFYALLSCNAHRDRSSAGRRDHALCTDADHLEVPVLWTSVC